MLKLDYGSRVDYKLSDNEYERYKLASLLYSIKKTNEKLKEATNVKY